MNRKEKKRLLRILLTTLLFASLWLASAWAELSLLLFLLPYFLIGYDVILKAFRNLFGGEIFDENFLMLIASAGAMAIGEVREGVAVLLLYQIGELFQGLAVGKSRRAIASLMNIRPDYAYVERESEVKKVVPSAVAVGEIVLVRPGERIPLDGIVEEGESELDTAALTGESLPRAVGVGDACYSGSINRRGVLRVRVTQIYAESTVSKILALVSSSAEHKARSETFIAKFARWYTPAVVIAALLLALLPPILLEGEWKIWIYRALTFLVVSCPCALVISVPLSFFAGIGGASRSGILIKGANYIEVLSRADVVAFDKTGTLTHGRLTVASVVAVDGEASELLQVAASVERYSHHPLAKAVMAAAGEGSEEAEQVEELAGLGLRGRLDGEVILVGNASLLMREGITPVQTAEAGSVVHVARDGRYLGYLVIADAVKEEAVEAIAALRGAGVRRTVMLTGDREAVARSVAQALGLDHVHAELLPQEKVACIEEELKGKHRGGSLLFVGDGINDAPVLARSDAGIAMGMLGSDAAMEAADVVIMDDRLEKIPLAIRLCRRTLRLVKQNIVFSLGVKGGVLLLSAIGLADMWWAVFADVGVCVIAVFNAMRALRPIR